MTTYAEMNEAAGLVFELNKFLATRDLQASDITEIAIRATTAEGDVTIHFRPTDLGWNALLSRINANAVDKIAAIKARLGELFVTGLPS